VYTAGRERREVVVPPASDPPRVPVLRAVRGRKPV